MKNIPKENIFKEPEDYFNNLPDQILNAYSEEKTPIYRMLTTWAAVAAVVVLGIALFVYTGKNLAEQNLQATLEPEIELYISSGYLEAEDVLIISDDPNEILDMIILSEWSDHDLNDELYIDDYLF